jgi:serine/threonine-protein kinase
VKIQFTRPVNLVTASHMSLSPGTRIGPYEITSQLGAGGMGEVYRAKDTKLHRDVAIKALQPAVAGDHERISRFEREAQLLASLHHPNIAGIHGLEQSQGATYLILEFVEGKALDRILRESGAMAPDEAVIIGRQIADAIAAAHEKGIIHRDLKPGNVMLTPDGQVKVLDFGLGKALIEGTEGRAGGGGAEGTESPTITLGSTQAGIILGTAGYMSPEQAKGRAADRRSDVWSFGCLLFEMLAGSRAFDGEDVTDTIAAIVRGEPNWKALSTTTPPALRTLIERCLLKDRTKRLADMAVVRYVLDERSLAGQAVTPAARSSLGPLLVGLAIGAVVVALATFAFISMQSDSAAPSDTSQVSLSARIPAGVSYDSGTARQSMTLSPDGRTIAFVGDTDKGHAIFLRQLGQFDAVKLAGSDGGQAPFFSPTGEWIAFHDNFQLMKLPVGGGVPVRICAAPSLRGAVWLPDDTIVYTPLPTGGLMRVSAQGGTPAALTKLDGSKGEKTHRGAVGLPGGKVIVFAIGSNEIDSYDDARIVALTLDTGKQTELVKGGYAPAFATTGHLLYVRNATVFAVPLDPVALTVGTTPVQVLKDVASQPNYGTAEFAIADSGVLAYATGGDQSERRTLAWMDRRGNTQPMPIPEGSYAQMVVSPDGRRLSMVKPGANNTLMVYDIERDQVTRVTFKLDAEAPAWTFDNKRLAYWSGQDLRLIAADGSGAEEVLISAGDVAGRSIYAGNWSADGQKLDATLLTTGEGIDVGVYSRADKKWTIVAGTRYDEASMGLTADGRWVAFVSNESGRDELYVRAADGTGAKYPVSNGGASGAQWTRRDRELIYLSDKGVMSATFTPGPVPVIGTPQLLVEEEKLEDMRVVEFEVAPDGLRFVMMLQKPRPPLADIRVVTNWTQELTKIKR